MHEYNLRPREEQRCSFTAGQRRHGQHYQRSAKNAHSSTTTNTTESKVAPQPRSLTSEQLLQYLGNTVNVPSSTTPNATEYDICSVCQEKYMNDDDAIIMEGCIPSYHPDCVSPWVLGQDENTCPNCRAALLRMQMEGEVERCATERKDRKMLQEECVGWAEDTSTMDIPQDADSPLVLDLALRDDTDELSVAEVILDAEATSDENMMAYDSNNASYSDTPSSPPVLHRHPLIHWVHPPVVEVMPDTEVTNGDNMIDIDNSETMDSDTSFLASSDNEEHYAASPPSTPASPVVDTSETMDSDAREDNEEPYATPLPSAHASPVKDSALRVLHKDARSIPLGGRQETLGLPTPASTPLLPPRTLAPRRALPILSPQILPRTPSPGPRYHDPSLTPTPQIKFAVLWHHPAGSPILYYTSEQFHAFMQPGSRAEQAWIRGERTVWMAIPLGFTGRTVESGGWVYNIVERWRRGPDGS